MKDKEKKLTPEQKRKVKESWKAIQNLPTVSELKEERYSRLRAGNTATEDLIEELIPFSELEKYRKV